MHTLRKSILIGLLLLVATTFTQAQVGVGTTTPHASAKLEVSSTTQGFLPPRMTSAQRDLISTPESGLIIFNTTTNALNVYFLGAWHKLTTAPITDSESTSPTLSNSKAFHKVFLNGSGGGYNVIYSFDGTTWTDVSTIVAPEGALSFGNSSYLGTINGKAYHNFPQPGTGSRVLYSFDGTKWEPGFVNNTPANMNGDGYLGVINGKAYNNFFTGGSFVLYSFDGITWTNLSASTPENANSSSYVGVINGKAYHNVYQGSTSSRVLYSFDGTTWTNLPAISTPESIESYTHLGVINGIAYHNAYIPGVGNALYSFDGTTWTNLSAIITPADANMTTYVGIINGVAYHYVNTQSGYALYSFDGTRWLQQSITNPNGFFGGFLFSSSSYIGEF